MSQAQGSGRHSSAPWLGDSQSSGLQIRVPLSSKPNLLLFLGLCLVLPWGAFPRVKSLLEPRVSAAQAGLTAARPWALHLPY